MAKNIWGIIGIVLGVLIVIVGLITLVNAYDQAQQIEAAAKMMGNQGANMMNLFAAMGGIDIEAEIRNSYIIAGVELLIGIGLSIFGTKLLSTNKKHIETVSNQTVANS